MTTTTQVAPLRAAINALEVLDAAGLEGPWTFVRAIPGGETQGRRELARIGHALAADGVAFTRADTAVMLRLIVSCGGGVRLLFRADRKAGGAS